MNLKEQIRQVLVEALQSYQARMDESVRLSNILVSQGDDPEYSARVAKKFLGKAIIAEVLQEESAMLAEVAFDLYEGELVQKGLDD